MEHEVASIIRQYDFNLAYAKALAGDLDANQMTFVPSAGLVSHPAFTVGHLVSGSAMMREDLGDVFDMPQGWAELFMRKGPGDTTLPNPDKSLYPSRNALLQELERQHEALKHNSGVRNPISLENMSNGDSVLTSLPCWTSLSLCVSITKLCTSASWPPGEGLVGCLRRSPRCRAPQATRDTGNTFCLI